MAPPILWQFELSAGLLLQQILLTIKIRWRWWEIWETLCSVSVWEGISFFPSQFPPPWICRWSISKCCSSIQSSAIQWAGWQDPGSSKGVSALQSLYWDQLAGMHSLLPLHLCLHLLLMDSYSQNPQLGAICCIWMVCSDSGDHGCHHSPSLWCELAVESSPHSLCGGCRKSRPNIGPEQISCSCPGAMLQWKSWHYQTHSHGCIRCHPARGNALRAHKHIFPCNRGRIALALQVWHLSTPFEIIRNKRILLPGTCILQADIKNMTQKIWIAH